MRPRAMLSATAMVTSLAVAVVVAACASAQPQMSAAEAIEKRKALMKEQGAAWKNVQDKAKAGQIQAIVPDAEKLAQTAKQIPALFPEGSLDPDEVGGQARDLAEEGGVRRGGQESRDAGR